MNDSIIKRVIAVFLIMLAVLMIVAIVALRNIGRAEMTNDWVNHTHAVILQTDSILTSLHAGDAALRSYLITGDGRDQAAYRQAYNDMKERLEIAKAMTKRETNSASKVAAFEPLIAKRIDFTRALVKTREAEGLDGAKKSLLADSGGESLHSIQKAIAQFQEDQKTLLRERDKASFQQAETTKWTVLTGIGFNFLLLGFTGWLLKDDIKARNMAAHAMEEANIQLEAKVQERTAELAKANETLRAENLERQWSGKSLEHQLRYSNLIINSINDMVFVLTKSLKITRINPVVSHVTGMESKDLITTPLSKLVQPRDGAVDTGRPDPMAQALKEGRDLQNFPVSLVDNKGRATPYRLNLFPLRDRDKVVGGVVTLRAANDDGNAKS